MLGKISVTTSLVAVFYTKHHTMMKWQLRGKCCHAWRSYKVHWGGGSEGKGPLMIPRYKRFEVVLQNLATPSDIILLEKSTDDQLVKKLSPLYGYRRLITVSSLNRQLFILQETVI